MRFLIGLLLGFGIGFAGALLLAPEKRQEEVRAGEEFRGKDHDALAGLRRAMRQLQGQVQEAWEEARQAAEEAEEKMRARYERTVSKRRA